jgi:hypothetical protein
VIKNKSGQKTVIYAHDTDGAYTGDAANITAQISKDGGSLANTNDANPTEIGGGLYAFDNTAPETNWDSLYVLIASSSTAGVKIDPVINNYLEKNQLSQKVAVYAYDSDGGATGQAGVLTAEISEDGGAPAAIAGNPTEIGGGVYYWDIPQNRTDCDLFILIPSSSDSAIYVDPVIIDMRLYGGRLYTQNVGLTVGV